jgi:prevent-host-death family protein
MIKRYSIAEARQNLAALVHEVERASAVELTRRGEPVAMLLSIEEYRRLLSKHSSFWEAYTSFREAVDLEQLQIEPDTFEAVRDSSPGREVTW